MNKKQRRARAKEKKVKVEVDVKPKQMTMAATKPQAKKKIDLFIDEKNKPNHFGYQMLKHLHTRHHRLGAYAFQQVYPDAVMKGEEVGVPFLAPVPTAKVKVHAKFNLQKIQAESSNNALQDSQFFFSFSPEAVLYPGTTGRNEPNNSPLPLYYGYRPAATMAWEYDPQRGGGADVGISREQQVQDAFDFTRVAQMRVAAACIKIFQVQELVNLTGTGDAARIYGVGNSIKHAYFDKQTVLNSTYRNSVGSFNEPGIALRAAWAPADFTDLKFVNPNQQTGEVSTKDSVILPVLQGYISGINAQTSLIAVVDIILEYVPVPSIKAMISTSTTQADSKSLSEGENASSKNVTMDTPRVRPQAIDGQTAATGIGGGTDAFNDIIVPVIRSGLRHTVDHGGESGGVAQYIGEAAARTVSNLADRGNWNHFWGIPDRPRHRKTRVRRRGG